jgi:acyl phosphate:glycerol-3-phosphate acyltransferase
MFPAPYALVALAYLLGSVPFGLLISLLFAKRDVREVGSGNIGATNVVRAAGRWAGLATLLLDMAKGIAPTWLALYCFGLQWAVLTGAAAFLGHLFPVYLGFRGGKGVATGFGVFVVLAPWAALVALATYLIVWRLTHVSAAGSLGSLGTAAVMIGWRSPPPVVFLFAGVATLIVVRHRKNLMKLFRSKTR